MSGLRCDGSAHGGCQAACLLFWKTEWLRPADGPGTDAPPPAPGPRLEALARENASTRRADGATVFRCQATTLPRWTTLLRWWDPRQYWRDYRTGNASAGLVLSTLLLAAVYRMRRLPTAYRLTRWLYDSLHRALRGMPDPHLQGAIRHGVQTPDERTNLQVGEIVRIRPREEIERTINFSNRNRGLHIDEEMTIYCGGAYRVASRVNRIIKEDTGEMMEFQNPCIVLDGVDCLGHYSDRRLLCPRRITTYWREVWLQRVPEEGRAAGPAGSGRA